MYDEIVLFLTASSEKEAENIAERLLDSKKVACVNLIPKVRSLYWWKGRRESARETLMIAKSRSSLLAEIVRLVKEIHSYEVPEVIAVQITGGEDSYLNWVRETTR